MKTLKRIEIVAILLLVTIIIFASFFGIYKKEDFRVVNIIKDYSLGMDFTDARVITAKVNNEEKKTIYDSEGNVVEDDGKTEYTEENGYKIETTKINSNDILTTENYKLTKKILKKRLKGMNIGEYEINLNEETGEISIKIQENDTVDETIEHLEQKGVFTIIDKETEEVLLDNSKVKSAKVVYGASQTDPSSTEVYLQIDFNDEGAKKLEEISQIYISTPVENENEASTQEEVEETENEEENIKYVSVVIDGTTYSSTYFGEKMSTGVLYVPITQAKDNETLIEAVDELNNIATVINNGILPLEYNFSEETVQPIITKEIMFIGIAGLSTILLVACIVLIVKFKAKGFIATFLQIGYIAFVLLLIRYTNVVITIEGVVGMAIATALNYAFTYVMLKSSKQQDGKVSWETIGKFALRNIPVYVVAIILAFNKLTTINSIGMVLVWGSFGLYIYNLAITRNVLKMLK